MDILELAQKHYFHELERRSDLNRSLGIPLALITGLLTGTLSFVSELTIPFWWAEVAVCTLCGPAIVALLIATTNLVRSYVGYLYRYPPTIAEMIEWRNKLIENGQSRWSADEELGKLLLSEYADCARVNTKNNDLKSVYVHSASSYIVAAICILVVAAVPYLIVKADNAESPKQQQEMVRE